MDSTLRSSGEARRPASAVIGASIVVVIALASLYLLRLDRGMTNMAAMPMMMAWTTTDAFFAFIMWTVMMIGMMAPSAAPVLLLFGATRRLGHVLAFAIGYVALWTGFSACAALAQWGMHDTAMMSATMTVSSARIAGAIFVAAGVYQFTPVKRVCLSHCRTPLGFLMSHWRDGAIGAFRMGVHHGLYCVGCCWALMALLFAVGVMNLVWVTALAALVLVEKLGPASKLVVRGTGVAMILCGIIVVAGSDVARLFAL